jgi:hypothetical protein
MMFKKMTVVYSQNHKEKVKFSISLMKHHTMKAWQEVKV